MTAEYVRKRTARKPFEVGGVTWESYQVGVNTYTQYSVCKRASVHLNSYRATGTYTAIVDSETIGRQFRSERNACAAAAKVLKRKPTPSEVQS